MAIAVMLAASLFATGPGCSAEKAPEDLRQPLQRQKCE
jgi:hypothetical protein